MRKLHPILVLATIALLVASIVGPLAMQRASASATNPLLYPYNGATSISYNINDITAAWTAYKNARVTSNGAGGGVRVLFDDNSSTVSEGMGYGMLFTVIFDEQSNFDGMWRYVAQHLDSNGLMDWKINGSNTVTGSGAATDGDEDIALALVNACVKVQKGAWPASPSGYNYCNLATTMINAIYNTEIDKPGTVPFAGLNNNAGNELLPGDQWTTQGTYPNGIVNLSYFSPGYYTVFGKFTNNLSAWEAVNTRNYAITNLAQSKAGNCSKLVPNWNTYNGDAQSVSWQTNEYGWWSWDAARFAFRIAVDKAWYNGANAQETMNEVGGFFSSVGISNVKAQYRLDGSSVDSYDSAFFNANAAAAIWAAPNPIAVNCGAATATLKSTPQQAYDRLLAINDTTSYYSSAWRLFGLLLITGNFPNIYELGNGSTSPTFTPTATVPTKTNTPVITNTRTSTRTNTPVITNTPTRTATRTNTPVITNTPTRTATRTNTPSTPASLPDLTISSVTYIGASPTCANNPNVQVVVANIGVVPVTGSFLVALNGSAAQTVNGLAAGQSVTLIFAASSAVATVDSTNLITETNESNNSLTGNFGVPTQAPTCTPNGPTFTPTRTPTVTVVITPTITPTIGSGTCTPTSSITAPFTYDGAGTFCWQATSLGGYVNSWNTVSVNINGTNATNLYIASGSYPAKIGGFYYVSYSANFPWSHFEAK